MDKDLLIIGGGINGVGTAADAAGRGLSVILCETHDLASATSSCSSKLIHGGLRYLEMYDFALVRESLRERSILRTLAPHLVKPQPFVLPHCPWLRPFWFLRAGLFLYDALALDTKMPRSHALNTRELSTLELQQSYTKALEYYDCTADDSRLVLHVALLAKQHGAEILPRTKLVKATRKPDGWQVSLLHENDLKVFHVKAIVNATGPWVSQVATDILNINQNVNLRLVKGSHIIVRKLFDHNKAFVLQTEDKRVVFAIPYMQDFTLIGTTDVLLKDVEYPAIASDTEIKYLCDTVNQFLQKKILPQDVLYKYAGIRALHADGTTEASRMSRDYILDIDNKIAGAPAISIYGGKITTYRSLAEHVVDELRRYFPTMGKKWTKQGYLPGGYMPNGNFNSFKEHILKTYAPLPKDLLMHYINNYGTRTVELLMNSHRVSELGKHFGANLYQREVDYLVQQEWAKTAEDILWRRGKQGLWLTPEQVQDLERYLALVV